MPILSFLLGVLLAPAPADTVRLVLVATADMHGYVTDWDYLRNAPWPGGLARAATAIDSLRVRYPDQVVVVDAGDFLQGSAFAAYAARVAPREASPVIDAMNIVGYDAATVGDHDFDFGLGTFRAAIAGAAFPWVSANLRVLPGDTLAFPPYQVLARSGVRVAVTGFTTPGTMVWHRDELRGRYRVQPIDRAAPAVLREMAKDADLLVVLAHSGLDGPSGYDTTGVGPEHDARRLAEGAVRPHVVVVGHSHQVLVDSVIGGVHFVQPGPYAQSLAVVHVTLVRRAGRWGPVAISAERVPLEDVRAAPRVTRRLGEAHRGALGWAVTGLGEAEQRLGSAAARVEETPLIRLIHDVQRRTTGAQLSATPAFDLRAGFGPGQITQAELFQLYPVEATLRAIRISGEQLRAYLEQNARYFFVDSAGRVFTNRFIPGASYDLLGGVQYTFDLSRPVGQRVARLEVGGRAVSPTDSFTLALNSERQQGAGNFPMLAGAPVVYDRGQNVRDLLAAEIQRRKVLSPADFPGSDWRLEPPELARRARALFVREGPAPVALPEPAQAAVPTSPSRRELAVRDSILRARDQAEARVTAPVATLRLPAEPGAGRALGRLLADAYRNTFRADLALVRSDETGASLPAGAVTAEQVAAAAPGDDRLMTIRMSGADVAAMLEAVVAGDQPCCEVAGLRLTYDPRGRTARRVREIRLATGGKVERKRAYVVVLSTRLLDGDTLFTLGAGGCRPGQECRSAGRLDRWPTERSERLPAEALREYLRRLPQPVSPPEDQRLVPER